MPHVEDGQPRRKLPLSVRRIRLACGLVLFTYVTLHFINHALGNISVDAMDRGLALQKLIWQSAPGTILLYAALTIHLSLGFWALYERRQFRWTRMEAAQLSLGLCIPFLLATHVVGTRVALSLFGTDKGYEQELFKFWAGPPPDGAMQAVLLLVVWTHGCIGVHFWLKLKPGYARVKNLLLSFAVLLPTLALLGYYQGGRQTLRLAESPSWRAANLTPNHVGTPDENALLLNIRNETFIAIAALLAATILARGLRRWWEQRVGSIVLIYPDRTVRVRRGLSVLEASLINGIPHAHVCGGRGRCSTCRIRVLGDPGALPPISAAEQAVLDRVGAGAGVRLACQLRPTRDLAFAPLLPPHATVADVRRGGPARDGEERYVVVMFVDMRGSSRLAEQRLPYDTVFIINQFLNAVSGAVIEAGGEPNQVLGDGLLALFGLKSGPKDACRQAVAACAGIAANVEKVNWALAHGPVEPLRFGIGLHAGLIIAGDVGYERHAQFTVIGDAVNVAARLQDLTKPFGCEVLMSEEVYAQAGFGPDDLPAHEVDTKGREATVKARSAASAADLAGLGAERTGEIP
ncbi:MAG TPA: adenylate/guanylate cyclase domain-containing protein [Roseiarcus sp.]|nr:adenylate/guanylate cyclase domain-containing protein [Roseiarcus sp.]